MWRLIEKVSELSSNDSFLVGVEPCIVGVAVIENGKLVWPREGDGEEITDAKWWMPIPPLPFKI